LYGKFARLDQNESWNRSFRGTPKPSSFFSMADAGRVLLWQKDDFNMAPGMSSHDLLTIHVAPQYAILLWVYACFAF
jgi:hypothetical protein